MAESNKWYHISATQSIFHVGRKSFWVLFIKQSSVIIPLFFYTHMTMKKVRILCISLQIFDDISLFDSNVGYEKELLLWSTSSFFSTNMVFQKRMESHFVSEHMGKCYSQFLVPSGSGSPIQTWLIYPTWTSHLYVNLFILYQM